MATGSAAAKIEAAVSDITKVPGTSTSWGGVNSSASEMSLGLKRGNDVPDCE